MCSTGAYAVRLGVSPWLRDAVQYERGRLEQDAGKRRAELEARASDEPWVPAPAKRPRFGPGRGGELGSLGDRDRREMGKRTRKFIEAVRDQEFPAIQAARQTSDFDRSLSELVGSSRSGTMRLRMRMWSSMSRWLEVMKGRSWPASAADAVDYLHARLQEGGKQSLPRHLAASIRWMESRVGIADAAKISGQALFKRCFEKAVVEAEQGTSIRKAPRLPVAVVAALELGVLDVLVPAVLRVTMW